LRRQAMINNFKFQNDKCKMINANFKFLFIILLFTIYFSLFTVQAEGTQVAGKITKIEGRVDVLRVGTTIAVPLNVGESVSIGDILRTKSDGKAEITFIDNSVMSVGPKSRLGIDEYLYKPDDGERKASLKLYRGKTGFKIPRPVYPGEGSKFEMKTRTAVAGVRGTEGILFTDGIERVYVKEGAVEFYNPLGKVIISKGEVGEIIYGRAPVERLYHEREFKRHERDLTPMKLGKGHEGEKVPPPPVIQADIIPLPPQILPTSGAALLQTTSETLLLPTTQPPIPPTTPITDATATGTNTDVKINVNFPSSNVNVNVVFQ